MAQAEARQRALDSWIPKFVAVSAIWGTSFALIKIAVDAGVAPVWVALWRCVFGALALAGFCWARGDTLPRGRAIWVHATVVGALLNAAPFTLFAIAEQRVSSLLGGIINATTPLMTMGFAIALVPGEPVTRRRVAGVLLGFAGVACLLGAWDGLDTDTVSGVLACLAATLCYGAGFAYTRRFFVNTGDSAAALCLAQLLLASFELGVVAVLAGSPPTSPNVGAWVALAVLGVLGTGYAFLLNMQVIAAAGATMASTITYVVPIFSTAIGALLLSESVGWNSLAGGIAIIAGVAVARSQPRPGDHSAH